MLQGRTSDSGRSLARFGVNTVIGVVGIFDVATYMGLERVRSDFGLTLGRWGIDPGAYLVLPVLGPTTVRDAIGIPVDLYTSPLTYLSSVPLRNGAEVTQLVNTRENLLRLDKLLDDSGLDKYLFVRDAYLQRRRGPGHDTSPE
jgi:phospholipid-binding lipoprotein MlaA